MRKIATSLLALTLCAAFAGSASATVLLSDGFTYPNGNLAGNGGWANFSGAVTDIQVAAGRATGGAIGNPSNDDHIAFTAQTTTATTYACFEVTIPTPAAGQLKAIYFAALKDAGTSAFVSRVHAVPLAGGTWTLAISHSSTSTTAGVTAWPSALSFDTPYRVTINYNPVAKTSTMWINATAESDPSVTNTNASIAALAVSTFALRQSNAASTLPPAPNYAGTIDWNFSVDQLGVGTTFNDACFQVTPNKATTWGRVKSIYR